MDSIQQFFGFGMDRAVPTLLNNKHPDVALNIGAGNKTISNTFELDYPNYDFDEDKIPFNDNEVDVIHAYHFLEHLHEPTRILLEFQRVLKPGGYANIVVPYYSSAMAHQDLDHKKFFTEETWKTLFSNPYYNKTRVEWKLVPHFNMILGIVERNLALFTQLVKV